MCAHCLLGLEFPRLLARPSPSIRLLVYLFKWVLFSTRVPNLRDGVTPAGSRIVCPRSERRFSVPIWIRCTGQFLDEPCTSVCGVSARPVPQGVWPGGPRCVHELRLSLAPYSCWGQLSGWSSLTLRVLGGYWISPLCSHDRRSASRSTCSALPLVSRLSFGLGDFSFG